MLTFFETLDIKILTLKLFKIISYIKYISYKLSIIQIENKNTNNLTGVLIKKVRWLNLRKKKLETKIAHYHYGRIKYIIKSIFNFITSLSNVLLYIWSFRHTEYLRILILLEIGWLKEGWLIKVMGLMKYFEVWPQVNGTPFKIQIPLSSAER